MSPVRERSSRDFLAAARADLARAARRSRDGYCKVRIRDMDNLYTALDAIVAMNGDGGEDGAGGACAAILHRCLHAVRPVLAKHGAAARVEQLAVFEHAHSRLHRVEGGTTARENRATSFERGS